MIEAACDSCGLTYLLEIPHRFAGGLVLGWLRHKTNTLWSCILAHLINNLLACWL